MESYILVKPDETMLAEIAAYRREFLEAGSSMDGTGDLRQREDPAAWLASCRLQEDPETTPAGWVDAQQYVFLRPRDGRIVGMLQFRHRLNDRLARTGGHIGYSVRPSERRKGCATAQLGAALPLCRAWGLDQVLITCLQSNEASRRIILHYGGVFDGTAIDPEEPEPLQRYWVPTKGPREG